MRNDTRGEGLVMLILPSKQAVSVPDLTLWYGSVAMMVVDETQKKIEKPKT